MRVGPRNVGALVATLALAATLLASPTGPAAAAPSEPARRFAYAAHEDLLLRRLTPAEQDAVSARLDAGLTRSQLALELARTAEWVRNVVRRLYYEVLEREPDNDGLWHWTARVLGGERVSELAARLLASPELYARAGSDDGRYVDLLFTLVLGRSPDAAGRAHWVGRIQGDGSRLPTARAVHLSLESNGRRVDGLFRSLLGRPSDAAGRAYWAGRLRTIDDISLAASLVASPEYFTRAQTRPPTEPLEVVEPDPMPRGTVGEPYQVQLTVRGGTPPHRWIRRTSSPELHVVDGLLSGTPTSQVGAWVTVVDGLGRSVRASINTPIDLPLALTNPPLAPGRVGSPYRAVVDAGGGLPPYRYQVTGVPAGLVVDDDQVIRGVPTTVGTTTVQVRVTDAYDRVHTTTLPLPVAPPGAFTRLTAGRTGSLPYALSADGTQLLYANANPFEDHLPDAYEGGDDEDLFLMDLTTGRVRPVPGDGQGEGDLSDDGRYVAFDSRDDSLAPGASPHGTGTDVFLWDTVTDAVTRVTAGIGLSGRARISGDGRYVVYQASNPHGEVGLTLPREIYRWDRLTGETLRLTHSLPRLGAQHPSISDDGSVVGFQSSGLAPDDGIGTDAGVWEADTGETTRISMTGGGLNSGYAVQVSGDGSTVAFTSTDEWLGPDPNGWDPDLFVWDRATRTTSRVTSRPTVAGGWVAMTHDGSQITYLDLDPATGHHRLITLDRATGTETVLVEGDHVVQAPFLSDDGGTLVVQATGGLVPGDDDPNYQTYLRRRP